MALNIKRFLKDFSEDTRGSVAVEVAIILPMLLWAYIAMYVFFDAYKVRSTVEKAAFTISDMLSRETAAIDSDYMWGAHQLFDFLTRSDSPSGLRVTVITYRGSSDTHELNWSKVQGSLSALDASGLSELVDRLPTMADGETLILVETVSTYEPNLNVGLGDQTMETFIFTRPRFAPQLMWSS